MNETRMLKEIEVAHRLGVEVFVIDTGWYEKTGDWQVSRPRFPNGLAPVKRKLDEYGIMLGLWFNPTVAAVSSRILTRHKDCVTSWRGTRSEPGPIWETEGSCHMCLVSRYADAFVEESIRLFREVGVTYFKWDAVSQYGCDDPGHRHGGPEHSPEERGDCYAFRLGPSMVDIAERIREACPGAIVDFDVTEAGRFVGLGWLAASKYFLVNNGPYYQTYNLPLPPDQNWNMFFYPGPARGWICRAALAYDRWVPSVLFMGHYLTDDPEASQLINIGSLILGQNGVWGDLPAVSKEGVARLGELLSLYKQVREDITEAYPVRSGPIAGTPEIHEKICGRTGRGVVVVFSTRRGHHTYVTENPVAEKWWHTPGVAVTRDSSCRARLDITFDEAGARIVFFGAQ
jgi:alpha-galactosidase